jgi:hypothetical protein
MHTRHVHSFWLALCTAAACAAFVVAGSFGVADVLAQSALSFTDITVAAGMESSRTGSHGAFWADATGDGRPDLFLSYNECRSGTRANRFYRNLGSGSFVEEAPARGLYALTGGTHGGSFSDLDNDGDYDLITGETYARDCVTEDPAPLPNRVFRNDGGVFSDLTPPGMAAYADYTRSILGFDMDKDGDLDIFAVNGDRGNPEPIPDRNEVYRNDGNFNFTPVTSGPLVTTPAGQAGTDTDYDHDGDIDILVPNFGSSCSDFSCGDLGILRNDGNGVFTKVERTSIGIQQRASSGISTGDLNNDGLSDLVLVDQDRSPFRPLGYDRIAYVYLNVGAGRFQFLGEVRGIPGFTVGLADLDNDGDLDMTFPGVKNVLLNDGAARFALGPAYPTPTPAAGCVQFECMSPDPRTVSFADVDDDGDLDSVVTTKFSVFHLIRNNFNGGNWLKVRLTSPQGQAGAFGSKVRVFRAGTTQLVGYREAKNVYGYLSQDDPVLHFGLGSAVTVDVEVTFLDATRVLRQNVAARQTIAFFGAASADPPGVPRNLTVSVAGSVLTFNWQPPIDGGPPASYQLEAGSTAGSTDIGTFPLGLTPAVTASAPSGTYFVRVRARNLAGLSAPSNEVVATVGSGCAVPSAPSGLAFTVSGSLVTLTWTPPTGVAPSSYVIEVGSVSGATNLALIDSGSPATTLTASAPPGRYFVRVKARTACGTGPASNEQIINVGS